MLALQPQQNATDTVNNSDDSTSNAQQLRLRDDPQPITQQSVRASRKRKTPPTTTTEHQHQQPPQPQTQPQPQQQQQQHQQPQPLTQVLHVLPPPHVLMHHPQHLQGVHSFPQYAPSDYTPGGIPPQQPLQVPQPDQVPQQHPQQNPSPPGNGTRTLSNSKRAEQNRKAQRAFRERRDQHVKALESRSQLLDAALASADEANRRWEECRALVDQLRVENTALRAALSQAQLVPPGAPLSSGPLPPPAPMQHQQPHQAQTQPQTSQQPQQSGLAPSILPVQTTVPADQSKQEIASEPQNDASETSHPDNEI